MTVPPNPLPCGCGAKGWQNLEDAIDDGTCLHIRFKDVHVVHCPLHAAAPNLLAACKAALVKLNHTPLDKVSVAADMLRDAIAKAEGGVE